MSLEYTAKEILKDYPIIETLPAFISGKHHIGETAREHLELVVNVMKHLCKEFNISKQDCDLLVASAYLHDIGLYPISAKGIVDKPGWIYYDATGYSRLNCFMKIHPILSAQIIDTYAIERKEEIKRLAIVHMSHWYKECPQPDLTNLYEMLICTADYVASRGNGIFKYEQQIQIK